MSVPLLDDLELYSDLVASVGTGTSGRPLTPIECSDLIIRLKKETSESKQQLSKRLGIGRKRKIKTLDEPPDTTQITLFEKLQKLDRKNAYMLGFREDAGKIPFTIGCLVADLPEKNDHNIILKTVLASYGTKKEIIKTDIQGILERKRRSPDQPIEEIIKHVMDIKPVVDHYYLIGIIIDPVLRKNIEQISKDQQQDIKQVLKKLLETKFSNNEISSVSLKEKTLFISMEDIHFDKIENDRKSQKLSMTKFFNQILSEAISIE